MTVYGDLDVSTITSKPAGRQPIVTTWANGPPRRRPSGPTCGPRWPTAGRPTSCARSSRRATSSRWRRPRRLRAALAGDLAGPAPRPPPRPAAVGREGGDHGPLPRRPARRARGHDGHRGRRRRPQRHDDGHPRRRPLRHRPAPPAARPRRPGARPVARAAWSSGEGEPDGQPASTRWSPPTDGFDLAEVDLISLLFTNSLEKFFNKEKSYLNL